MSLTNMILDKTHPSNIIYVVFYMYQLLTLKKGRNEKMFNIFLFTLYIINY